MFFQRVQRQVTTINVVRYDMAMFRAMCAAWVLTGTALAAQTVDGHVVNALTGSDLAGVAVHLLPVREQAKDDYTAVTDALGRFLIEGIQTGAYTARYRAPHFWSVPGALDGRGSAAPVLVSSESGQVHLEARMQPIPRISGRVVDSMGRPVPNASLWFLWESKGCNPPSCFPFSHRSKTDSHGEYVMDDPETPGTWLLSAAAPSYWKPPEPRDGQTLGWAQTFYPGVPDPQLATRVIVQQGAELADLEIKLAAVPVHRIRGTVLDLRGDPVRKVPVELAHGFGPIMEQETGAAGTFEFEAVPDAEWRVSAKVEELWATQSARVQGRDLENVDLRLAAPFSLHGKVVMEVPDHIAAPEPPPVMMAFNGSTPQMLEGDPDEKGSFQIANVHPGQYEILPGPPPAGFYLDGIRLGGRDALAHDIAILSDVEALIVTYKQGGGTVRGTVDGCAGGRVMLIPQEAVLRRGLFVRTVTCDPDGRFEFPVVRPGDYYGLAVAGDGPLLWSEALMDDRLMGQTSRVTVRANEVTSAELRLTKRQ